MGVLATLAAALFPDYNTGTSTPHSPSMADLRSFAAAIDNAYPNAQDLTALSGRVDGVAARVDGVAASMTSAENTITGYIQGETVRAENAENIVVGYVQAETTRATTREDAIAASVAGAMSAVPVAKAAQADASAARAATDALPAQLAASAVAMFLAQRPGEVPAAFTSDLASSIAGVPTNSASVAGPRGRVLRITGSATVACLAPVAIEPNRTYKVRAVLSRAVDPSDPSGDAVRFAVAWYGADRNAAPVSFSVAADDPALIVAAGRVQREALFSLNPPDQTNLANPRVAQPPAGAVYFRPFLQTYGADGVTDVELLDRSDVTDAATVTLDLDAILARVSRVEAALNLPPM